MQTYKENGTLMKAGNAFGVHRTYYGLSSDVKPTRSQANGNIYVEVDTGDTYFYDEQNETWLYFEGGEPMPTSDALCFTAKEDGATIGIAATGSAPAINVEYSTDGENWNAYTVGTTISLNKRERIYFRGDNNRTATGPNAYNHFVMTGTFDAKNSVMSLIDSTLTNTDTLTGNFALLGLFADCAGMLTPPKLTATTLSNYCYSGIFSGCSGLTKAPELPATNLSTGCYLRMFENCTSLSEAPVLNAMTMTYMCYSEMFSGCSSITTAPVLPSTSLSTSCYQQMFKGTSLTAGPVLPAMTLDVSCYAGMFQDCQSLTNPPALPATTIGYGSYESMFENCRGLTHAPSLSHVTAVLEDGCLWMFKNCRGLQTPPALPATNLEPHAYKGMFEICIAMTRAPELPALRLVEGVYQDMFKSCVSLRMPPALPAEILNKECYAGMFSGCTALKELPDLNVMELEEACYKEMFKGCTSIKMPARLPATELKDECYASMFENCTGIDMAASKYDDYATLWKITATDATDATLDMFEGTSGDWSGTPDVNFDYYVKGMNWLEFTAEESDCRFGLRKEGPVAPVVSIEYSRDDGATWQTLAESALIVLPNIGDKVLIRGNNTAWASGINTFVHFTSTKKFSARGDISSILGYDLTTHEFVQELTQMCQLAGVFYQTKITRAPELPATTLSNYCYAKMFMFCSNLVTPPELPAENLTVGCYEYMFENCTSLKKAPALPSTNIATSCYYGMFDTCSKLTKAPELPAMVVPASAYERMFYNCAELLEMPQLPAETLGSSSYKSMFGNCKKITRLEALPTLDLGDRTYEGMFQGCESIKLATTEDATYRRPFRIPLINDGTATSTSLTDMFAGTGGTFTGTPAINTVYYGDWD